MEVAVVEEECVVVAGQWQPVTCRKFELIDVNERPVAMYRTEPRMRPWWR